jgi:hypothetical protein
MSVAKKSRSVGVLSLGKPIRMFGDLREANS